MYTGQTKLTSSGTNNKKRFKISPCFDYWSEKAVFKNKKIFHNIALDLRFKIKIPQSGICPAPCALRQCTVVFA